MNPLDKHYQEFMGVDISEFNKDKRIFKSKYRDLALNNKYFYPIIQTKYFGQPILSVSPKYYNELIDISNDEISSLDDILKKFLINNPSYKKRKMHRYVYPSNNNRSTISQRMTSQDVDRLEFCENFNFEEYKRRKKKIFEEGRQFIVEESNKIASIGFISEIRAGAGNIVVMTMDCYRGKGYGKEVVKGCINWCIEKEILPIYLVEEHNYISQKIPESLGFDKISDEIIISK
ncbi:GNAT family N-acetyltransferase [Clostridium sp. D2Q-11]|uniref:GNAT family N-acetyltransferase n=1 Tax=Anaeromonas frigoriresistens TaxID=2683708 RepID=A0A942V0G4_9FIRM|nr:GNAT family N-acetyltransferase [Anaeromonas frigoriresistens]MBS4538917.1 GNAT family N-acetyltransferase [Anaeromonas frigoriresistens]